ncbi:hypothetical protein NPIL_471901 [Nephila pilipes]|uniref:Uncharacterized protein n=1 Tax=Nephila pilipes TaxID=299642 RepID=A0A8X6N481_NEPPI|nr:hypothetical protein NPIL_471901 [Nephila pilipes]
MVEVSGQVLLWKKAIILSDDREPTSLQSQFVAKTDRLPAETKEMSRWYADDIAPSPSIHEEPNSLRVQFSCATKMILNCRPRTANTQ